MDALLLTAWVIVGTYVGFVVGVLLRAPHIERRPPGGGEPPQPPPDDPGPEDWALWEEELATAPVP